MAELLHVCVERDQFDKRALFGGSIDESEAAGDVQRKLRTMQKGNVECASILTVLIPPSLNSCR